MLPMTTTTQTRRATCATCLRAQTACMCGHLVRVGGRVEVLVLQHPLEAGNAKNSARLLHLCLPGSALVAGEVFDRAQLHATLHAGGRVPVLLYPPSADGAPAADASLLASPERIRLVVLDATWRKSRKMLYLNPLLQGLPRLSLDAEPPSRYRIRKAHAGHQLSTLEATAYALERCEGGGAYGPLLQAFDGFVAQQAAFVPRLNSD